jgi:hypothetical protein
MSRMLHRLPTHSVPTTATPAGPAIPTRTAGEPNKEVPLTSVPRRFFWTALVAVGVLASVVFMAAPSWAAKSGNSANAKKCQKGGWETLFHSNGTGFNCWVSSNCPVIVFTAAPSNPVAGTFPPPSRSPTVRLLGLRT